MSPLTCGGFVFFVSSPAGGEAEGRRGRDEDEEEDGGRDEEDAPAPKAEELEPERTSDKVDGLSWWIVGRGSEMTMPNDETGEKNPTSLWGEHEG